jgi:hypothetical protein
MEISIALKTLKHGTQLPHPLLYIPTLSLSAVSGSYSMNRESCALPGFMPHGVVILILISVPVFVEVSL